jgi:hypothetical protein
MKDEYHPVLWEFRDVFLEETPGLHLKIDLDFLIDLVAGEVPMSRMPYKMSMPDLIELKV